MKILFPFTLFIISATAAIAVPLFNLRFDLGFNGGPNGSSLLGRGLSLGFHMGSNANTPFNLGLGFGLVQPSDKNSPVNSKEQGRTVGKPNTPTSSNREERKKDNVDITREYSIKDSGTLKTDIEANLHGDGLADSFHSAMHEGSGCSNASDCSVDVGINVTPEFSIDTECASAGGCANAPETYIDAGCSSAGNCSGGAGLNVTAELSIDAECDSTKGCANVPETYIDAECSGAGDCSGDAGVNATIGSFVDAGCSSAGDCSGGVGHNVTAESSIDAECLSMDGCSNVPETYTDAGCSGTGDCSSDTGVNATIGSFVDAGCSSAGDCSGGVGHNITTESSIDAECHSTDGCANIHGDGLADSFHSATHEGNINLGLGLGLGQKSSIDAGISSGSKAAPSTPSNVRTDTGLKSHLTVRPLFSTFGF
uniref:Uncharacterized protein n=1 Tax=Glossina brevipalpis TaxID=37001 RepID=A0A1A9WED4_9MUSC